MPVIAVVGNKGGVGKTTLSVNLAAGLAKRAPTAVIDADPQGSSLQWRAIAGDRGTLPVYAAQADLGEQARELGQQYKVLILDCPPSVHAPQTNAALSVANLAMIPVQPSPMDLWATVHIEQAVADARGVNPGLKAVMVINQLEVRTTLSRLVRDALAEIDFPVAKTALRRRAVFRNAALEGKTVFEMGSVGADAAAELQQLIQEITKR